MKYLFKLNAVSKGKKLKAGETYELDKKVGDNFVKRGAAKKVNV